MKEYLSRLIPRLKEFSETLDRKEILIDQPWILIDEELNKSQYIFERNGRLIVSINGDAEIGKWEYILAAKSLLLEIGNEKLLLKQAFADKGVLILRKDAVNDHPVTFVNERIIPDLDIENYLKKILAEKLHLRSVRASSGVEFEYSDPQSVGLHEGATIFSRGEEVPDGIYEMSDDLKIVITNSKIVRVLKELRYNTDRGIISVQLTTNVIQIGCLVKSNGKDAPDGHYNLLGDTLLKSVTVRNSKIAKIKEKDSSLAYYLIAIVLVVAMVFFAIITVNKGDSSNSPSVSIDTFTVSPSQIEDTVVIRGETPIIRNIPYTQIKSRLENFSNALFDEDNDKIRSCFSATVKQYFNRQNLTNHQVLQEIINYRTNVVMDGYTYFEKDSLSVQKANNGYIVKGLVYDFSILRRDNIAYYYVTDSEYHFDEDLKINSVDGIVIKKGIDYRRMLGLQRADGINYDEIDENFFNILFTKLNSLSESDNYKEALKKSALLYFSHDFPIYNNVKLYYLPELCDLLQAREIIFDKVISLEKSTSQINRINIALVSE